jgi:threonine dehydratase
MPISPENIVEARRLLKPIIHQTPIIPDEKLGNKLGAKVFLKAECMQRGGSFKVRGAFTKISSLTEAERQKGVITASAGNHAQGVALAAKLLGVKATIVLPDYAPLTKIAATKALGAEVILKGDSFDAAVAYSRELEKQLGLTYVHAFDDELIITGQASIGCEINEEIPGLTKIVVPIGGGGLASGVALAAKFFNKSVKVYGVQAENVTSINPSLVAGEPLEAKARPTIADGIAVKRPGKLTLPIIRDNVEKVLEVSEEEIAAGVYHCVQNAHLVAEGAGAASVAALLAGKIPINDNDIICAIIAGGNIDGNLLSRILEQVLVRQGRYVIFKMLVLDRPGSLASMLERVAEAGANVMEINHQRAIWLAPLGYTGIEMILEVRDEQHAKLVHKHLEDCGYHLVREGQGDWN